MHFEKVSSRQWGKDCPEHKDSYNDIKIPKQATQGSMGMDFFAPYDVEIPPQSSVIIPTGIRWICPNGLAFGLMLYPRSGMGFKYRVSLANTVGIIDADYAQSNNEGHIMVKLYNPQETSSINIEKGKGFCQGVITAYFICNGSKADDTKRDGGFGSTDKE